MLKNNNNVKLNLNNFFTSIKLKKQYIKKLQDKICLLNSIKEKSYKLLGSELSLVKRSSEENYLISYIIDITFSQTNTLLHVTDPLGNLKFFCSAGSLNFKGKAKRSRFLVFREMYNILISKLKFLKGQPIGVHFKNVGSSKFWMLKKLKKKFFIRIVKSFSLYPYNGCRKPKMRRKKFKKKEKWSSGLRRQIVNLLSFLIVGSNPAFFI
jgi:ribosomal protein S11